MRACLLLRLSLLLVGLFIPTGAAGQDFCSRALADRPFPRLRNATNPVEGSDMRGLVWSLALSRALEIDSIARGLIPILGHGYVPQPEWFSDSAEMPDSIKRLEPKDSVRRWDVAFQLSSLFNGGALGGTGGMGYAAASLYRFWPLPPEPAVAFLADPAFSASARSRAVRALESSWSNHRFDGQRRRHFVPLRQRRQA